MTPVNPTCDHRQPVRPGRRRAGLVLTLLLALSACTDSAAPPVEPTTTAASTTTSTSLPSISTTVSGTVPTAPTDHTTTEPSVPLRIGLVGTTAEGSSNQEIGSSVEVEVAAAGAELVSCDPGTDGAQLLGCLRRMTAQEVDGWVLLPGIDVSTFVCDSGVERPADEVADPDSTEPGEDPTEANSSPVEGDAEKTVPLIVIGAGTGCETAVAGPDETEVGRTVGVALGERALADPGCTESVLVVLTDEAAPWSEQRSSGITEGYRESCPDTEPVRVAAADHEQSFAAMTSALVNLPPDTRVLIAATDDTLALGALAAVPDARADQVLLASVGADRRARCTMRTDDRWIGDAALWPDRYGQVVVPALLDAIAGEPIREQLVVPSQFLDSAVLDVFYPLTECPGP